MTTTTLELTAHDPLVARDGRPFGVGQGVRMRGMAWPLPSVVAGSYRTALGRRDALDFTTQNAQKLLAIEVAGAFPAHAGQLYFPAPHDCVVKAVAAGDVIHRTRPEPLNEGAGCDWPDGANLRPVLLAREGDFKPKDGPAWWPSDRLAEWLTATGDDIPAGFAFDGSFLSPAVQEMRTHVQLDADTGAAAESRLFATSGLNVTHLPQYGAREDQPFAERFAEVKLAVRVRADGWPRPDLDTWHPLGGERRLVHWGRGAEVRGWACPEAARAALAATTQVRLVLATPATFKHGWRPDWVKPDLTAEPPGSGVRLTLVGVSIPRWRAVSGWSMQPLPGTDKPGPKPIRRMAPAGGVYFFETSPGGAAALADRWLEPVSDDEQDRRDGFGLAAWGVW